ncbi:hypothetical protein AVEN_44924-1 [Araneus ventricosus]|uniref:Uncharacterized protein n=1 Tax=Araneus ventricosus TaxID=182803 RepID=A0A4Y2GUK5_ARAVE|nr:hypothetical protein AVEN_44924-1 [Araneus ventricosus]
MLTCYIRRIVHVELTFKNSGFNCSPPSKLDKFLADIYSKIFTPSKQHGTRRQSVCNIHDSHSAHFLSFTATELQETQDENSEPICLNTGEEIKRAPRDWRTEKGGTSVYVHQIGQ